MDEHGALTLAGPFEHGFDNGLVHGITVHGGEQTGGTNFGNGFAIEGARIYHGPGKEAVGMSANGGGDGIVIAGQTGDESGAVDTVAIKFAGPQLGEFFRLGRWEFPLQLRLHGVERQTGASARLTVQRSGVRRSVRGRRRLVTVPTGTGGRFAHSFPPCAASLDNCVSPLDSASCVSPATLLMPSFFIMVLR